MYLDNLTLPKRILQDIENAIQIQEKTLSFDYVPKLPSEITEEFRDSDLQGMHPFFKFNLPSSLERSDQHEDSVI